MPHSRRLGLEQLEHRLTTDAALMHELSVPTEVRSLISEAVQMTLSETEWVTPSPTEASLGSLANGTQHLNLRGIDGLVRGVRGTALPANPAVTLMAHVFRGNDVVATFPVPSSGAFSHESDDGFTDIVFVPSARTVVSVTNVQTSSLAGMPDASTDALNQFSSKSFATLVAPSVLPPTNLAAAVKTLNLTGSPSGNGEKRFYAERDPNQYTVFRIEYSKGSGNIAWVGTIMKTGTDHMGREQVTTSGFPEGYMQRIDANTVVIAPGAPRLISFAGGFSGATGRLTMREGATMESVLPPAMMNAATVDTSMLQMNDQFRDEGIFPGATEIRESSSPTFSKPGDIANVWYSARNEALNGGPIGFDVYVGWYAGDPTRGTLQKRFDTVLAGGQPIKLSVNVTAPARPADATSDRPIISLVTRFQNGTTETNSRLGKEPQAQDVRVITVDKNGHPVIKWESQSYTDQEQARIRELTDRAIVALTSSTDERLTTIRDVLGRDRLIEILAHNAAESLRASLHAQGTDPYLVASEATDFVLKNDVENSFLESLNAEAFDAAFSGMTLKSAIEQHESLGRITYHSGESSIRLEGNAYMHTQTFELTQPSMVNIWLSDVSGLGLRVLKDGKPYLEAENDGYQEARAITARMDAGTYEIRSTRLIKPDFLLTPLPFGANLHVDVKPFNSGLMTSIVTRPNSGATTHVQLQRFVKLPNGAANMGPDLPPIDAALPTWIVIHGRNDTGPKDNMLELATELDNAGYQVVLADWSEGAGDNIPNLFGMQGEQWIDPSADKFMAMLSYVGLEGANVRIAGHSWGSFVGYAMAEKFKAQNGFGVDTFVALDSAKDPTLGSRFVGSRVDFAAVSKHSWAFHSSFFGSAGRAYTARNSIEVRSPRTDLTIFPEIADMTSEHSLAVTAFGNLIQLQLLDPDNSLARRFGMGVVAQHKDLEEREGYDAWMYVKSFWDEDAMGNDFVDAMPHMLYLSNPDDAEIDEYFVNQLNYDKPMTITNP